MRSLLFLLIIFTLLAGCAPAAPAPAVERPPQTAPTSALPAPTPPPETVAVDPIQSFINGMTIEERVGQLFLARCNSETAIQDIESYHFGGLILFSQDFKDKTPDSIRETTKAYQLASQIPLLLAVDEEGGTVIRISRYPAFRSSPFPSPRKANQTGGLSYVLEIEQEKCSLLSSLGLNVNMGPVCDVTEDPSGFMYQRSFGQSPETTGEYVAFTVDLMQHSRIGSVLKHFPGYGDNTDTHAGIAIDSRSLEELENRDLIPFQYGIRAGCGAILVSHTIVDCLDPELPASLSPAVHSYLRDTMGFTGVILTDDLVMQAVTDQYGAEEAAVLAVLAGNDLLCSTEYAAQYEAVLAAVLDGRIPMETLDAAVYRVLTWKHQLGLI